MDEQVSYRTGIMLYIAINELFTYKELITFLRMQDCYLPENYQDAIYKYLNQLQSQGVIKKSKEIDRRINIWFVNPDIYKRFKIEIVKPKIKTT